MGDLRYTSIGIAQNVTVDARPVPPSLGINGWERLLAHTAPNALHDSMARYDPPKCDEDTRVLVIKELTNWIVDRESPQRLLCMTGAAGSGKSALQQTIAEFCSGSNILGSAYFFGAVDSTRNTTHSLVPTIAYQLGRANPGLKEYIGRAVEEDELIFARSLYSQMTALVCNPVRRLRASRSLDLASFRYAILIDGLDECQGEDHQAEILKAIQECLLDEDLPFRIFIASRPEWALRSALEPGGELNELAYHIPLSDRYDATADIRRYLQRSLRELGVRSRDPRARSPGWFTHEDIEHLVFAASGQFIYAATVVRYMSEPRSSPVDRLKIVLTWAPADGQSVKPFEKLDLLYYNILSTAKIAYEAVDTHSERDFLLLFRVYHINSTRGFINHRSMAVIQTSNMPSNEELDDLLQLGTGAHEIIISDLRSLMTIQRSGKSSGTELHVYHKSFSDFLDAPSRSKDLFVPDSRVLAHLAKHSLRNVIRCPSWEFTLCKGNHSTTGLRCWSSIYFLQRGLWECLLEINDDLVDFTRQGGWKMLTGLIRDDSRPDPCNLRNILRGFDQPHVFHSAIRSLQVRI
ncbi:hypothetical protein EST38_g6628 [Candolleomyces aberdarensis]|uniref:Nephrocystin 3-like N-terminal domain-containing protein n=1 Tax=Candolleomyces aberdarensis TaxID=2316362 RepID=A0A4Q2DHB7_9AGAR|nr:hypothetical protein EST38_g6628 [Candolleomyces aberdarensis]